MKNKNKNTPSNRQKPSVMNNGDAKLVEKNGKLKAAWELELPRETSQRLNQIEAEINKAYGQIHTKHVEAWRLLCDALGFAKQIGDRLLEVKKLVGHGHYEDWVKRNFWGRLSTARVYTRIAESENWQKIQREMKGYSGRMTMERALCLLRDRGSEPEEKKEDELRQMRQLYIRQLVNDFRRLISGHWSAPMLAGLAYDGEFIDRIEEIAKTRHQEKEALPK
jgi:hypothetical protein